MAFACPVPVRYPLKVDDHDKKFSVDIRDKLDKKCQDRLRRLKESSRLVNVTAVLREEQTVGCRCNMHGKRYPSVGIARKMKRSTRSTPNIDKVLLLLRFTSVACFSAADQLWAALIASVN